MSRWGGRAVSESLVLVLATYGTRCHLCGREGADTQDHLLPRVKGGDNSLDNLRPAHRSCNSMRQDLPLSEWFRRHPLPVDRLPPSRDWLSPPPDFG